jgi:hypothetical protein
LLAGLPPLNQETEDMAGETERYQGNADNPVRPDLTPEIELLKGLLGQRGAAVITYIQVRSRRLRCYSGAVQEDSGLGLEEIAALAAENERLCDLYVSGAEASARTADDFQILLLARVVADALTNSAKINAAEVRAADAPGADQPADPGLGRPGEA